MPSLVTIGTMTAKGFGAHYKSSKTTPSEPLNVAVTYSLASATVSWVAPLTNGGSPITQYTITSSSGSSFTTTSLSYIFYGVTAGIAYTYTVKATNIVGTGPNGTSTTAVHPGYVGFSYGGGIIAAKISTSGNGVATHFLILSPKATGASASILWSSASVNTSATSVIDGYTNSVTLAGLGAGYAAATFARNLSIGGYTDWYLPAIHEMGAIYYNFKPQLATAGNYPNDVNSGANPYAVSPQPINSNYTLTNPARTGFGTSYYTGGAEAIDANSMQWLSTQSSSTQAYSFFPRDGTLNIQVKTQANITTRAIRKVAIF